MKKISLLGASGSIGTQTIEIIKNNPDKFELVAFSVGKNIGFANEIIKLFPTVKVVSVQNKEDIATIKHNNVVFGKQGLIEVATIEQADVVLTAVVGSVGLIPTIEAIKKGKNIALANKETLVIAGDIIMPLIKENNVSLLPVDSEHSAIFQALDQKTKNKVNKIILTASGGSFRDKTLEELENVTIEETLNHPNWSMGSKITVDSATMFNKGLEVIEAHHLFNVDYDKIEVLIHHQSIIHSMVEFEDYGILAQLGIPDMRLPIQYALTYPERKKIINSEPLDLAKIGTLNFEKVDFKKYEALKLAIDAGKKGHTAPTVLNAANEVAVELFLNQKINFLDIVKIVKKELNSHTIIKNPTIEEIFEVDQKIREKIRGEFL